MQKRIWMLLTAIALICGLCGCADDEPLQPTGAPQNTQADNSGASLAIQLGVPERFQAEYVSDTGISVLTVDAEVVIPDVSSVDIIEAVPRVFTDEELREFVAWHYNEVKWLDHNTRDEYNGRGFEIDNAYDSKLLGYTMYDFWITSDKEPYENGGDFYSIHLMYALDTKNGKVMWPPKLEYLRSRFSISTGQVLPLTDGKAEGCTITLTEAIVYADAEAHVLSLDYELTNYGQIPVFEAIQNPQYYIFRYTRHLNGIPVNDDNGGEAMSNDYDYASGLGVITIIVRDDGVCFVEYCNPYDVGEVVEADCELLSFDEIMDIYSKIGLLSIQYLEREEGLEENTMHIYKIQFGYMTVRQPDNIDAYYYVPVWDFYGTRVLFGTAGYAHGKDYEPELGNSCLTINAVDGTIIDRTLGY